MIRPRFQRRISLYVKLVAILLAVVLAPLAASAYLIDQAGKVAANFAAGEAASRDQAMNRALAVYRDLVSARKLTYTEVAHRLAERPAIAALDPTVDLAAVLTDEPGLTSITLRDGDRVVAHAERSPPPETTVQTAEHPLAGGAVVEVGFPVPDFLARDYAELGSALDASRRVAQMRTALPLGYRRAFLALVGAAALAAVIVGVFAAYVITRRIASLVDVARAVSAGRTDARSKLRGRDEMAELGQAFDTMLDDLGRHRTEIEYLQRIGAWQDVARRLAHEIKNPLTPIQLAVQQCVSQYPGDDPRFKKLLADTGEIVAEEIAGLRRLVDTFRTLGQLPRVEAAPVPLADIFDDLGLDPEMGEHLVVETTPARPVKLRADKLLLKRVVANLVENGVHAGREAGRPGAVAVAWRAGPTHATITFDDEGKGVRPEARDRIFEPYVTTKTTGTGLGLAIAKKIALEHGGTLEVAAEPAPTGGARFVLTVPLADEPAAAGRTPPPGRTTAST